MLNIVHKKKKSKKSHFRTIVLVGRGQKREGGHGGAGPGRGRGCRHQGITHHFANVDWSTFSHKHFDNAVDPNPDSMVFLNPYRDPDSQNYPQKLEEI